MFCHLHALSYVYNLMIQFVGNRQVVYKYLAYFGFMTLFFDCKLKITEPHISVKLSLPLLHTRNGDVIQL